MADIWGGQASTGRYKRKKAVVPTFKGDLRPPSGILRKNLPPPKLAGKGSVGIGAGSNPAPADKAAAAKAAAVAAGSPDAATIIGNYNLARARILQDMAPQVQGIYSQATKDLGGVVGGLTSDLQQRLYDVGGGKAAAFGQIDPRIAASYNIDAAPNAAYNLGAAIPGESLAKQGAAFGAAAAFAPERALTEGQYAVQASVKDAAEAAAKAGASNSSLSRVNASASKLLGYLVDSSGQAITGKNGKPIKIPEAGLTPYQQASLGLSAARLKTSTALASERINQTAANREASNQRYYAGLSFRSAQAAQTAKTNSKKIDSTASKARGYLVNKNGDPILDAHRRTIPVQAASSTQVASAGQARVDKALQLMANGTPDTTRADGTVSKPGKAPLTYSQAIGRLVTTYNIPRGKAIALANQYYAKGVNGRPLVDAAEVKSYVKNGVPPQYVKLIKQNDPVAYSLVQAFGQENGWKLDTEDLALLRQQGVAEGIIKRAQKNKGLAFKLYAWLYEDDLRKQAAAQANG